MKATATPWTIRHQTTVCGPEHRLVASCGGRQSSAKDETPENIANARLIVRAVNEREELLKALKAIREFMIPGMNWTDETGQELIRLADAAITEAETQED